MLSLAIALHLTAAPLELGIKRYGDLDYEACVAALAPAVDKLRGGQRALGELYLGLCLFALGDEAGARRHLELALRLDAGLEPPPAASPKERSLFAAVSRAVAASPKPAPKKTPRRPKPPGDAPSIDEADEGDDGPPPPEEPVAAEPPPPAPVTPPAPAITTEVEPAPTPPSRWPALVSGGVAVASLGVFAGFGVWGVAQRGGLEACRGSCAPERVAEVDRLFWVADVALALAVVAAAVSIVLLLVR